MKLAKLSLAAIVVAGLASSSFAADTLADAFKNGKVSGELRAWYMDREGSNAAANSKVDSGLFSTGLVLGYVTDSFYGFSIGATMQSSYSPFADGPFNVAGNAKNDFATDFYGSGAVLSEAYVAYTMKNTQVKVGRQFISTPLVNGSGSRMIKQAFEGAVITNTDLPQTTIAAGVVTKYQGRTSNSLGATGRESDVADFTNLNTVFGDYAYTLLAINKSLPGTTLTAQWAGISDQVDFYYGEAAYAGVAGAFKYGLAANYEYKSPEVGKNGTMYGAKASLGYGDFNTYAAYTTITNDGDVAGVDGGAGFGGGAQSAFARAYSSKTGTYNYSNTDAYSIDANYNFKSLGLLVGARYTDVNIGSGLKSGANSFRKAQTVQATGLDFGYTDIYAVYNFVGALKGLQADVSYQDWGKDAEGHDFWFKGNYKF